MDSMQPEQLRILLEVRTALLHLHKALLDGQRRNYEREHGKVATPMDFLRLAIGDPSFEWLHRFSELVIEIDESTEADEPISAEAGAALLQQARQLLLADKFLDAVKSDADANRLGQELRAKLG